MGPKQNDKDLIKKLQEKDDHSNKDYHGEALKWVDLAKKDFTKADLSKCNFFCSNLVGCNFTSSNLTDTDFTGANLSFCNFTDARRGEYQIKKYGSIVNGEYKVYGFLVSKGKKITVLINETNIPEYEYTQVKAKHETRLLYNLLVNG